jgi:PIN domain nuclease of toxin-antitoxin system
MNFWIVSMVQSPMHRIGINLEIIPLSVDIALESTILPGVFHKDPVDQIIVASARQSYMTLLTTDKLIISNQHVKTFN